ncbi:MAG TPA: Zn-ribbon domain-containing OB-fold protein [Hyphomicrobiaceae bacterium]|nr:Zn-ribbon domain-containing OB-fold protein [Hyphomicrobiaceae bacterium]
MTTDAYLKPVPEPTHESKPYWDALNEGRLLLQSCGACGRVRHYPRPLCDACYSFDVRWIEAKGHGAIHSWTITHHAFNPGFKAELPYVLATVDLTEGVRMQAPLRGVNAEDLRIGMPVRVTFERAKNGLTLPAFVAAGSQ